MLQLQQPFSQGGPKRGNPTMTTSTVTARTKGTPQHYVEEIKNNTEQVSESAHVQISRRGTPIFTNG